MVLSISIVHCLSKSNETSGDLEIMVLDFSIFDMLTGSFLNFLE